MIVGDFDPKGTMKLITRYYGGWQKGYQAPDVKQEPPQHGERDAEVTYSGRTLPILDIAYKGDALNPNNRDFVSAILLGDLAFDETSDIYKKLVIQEQKVQNLGCSTPINRDMPLFEIYSMVKKAEDIDSVRDDVYRTLEVFKTTPVDEKRLNDLKRRSRYSFLMGLDTPDHVAGGVARFVALTGGLGVIDQLYDQLMQVTPQDIMHAAKKYFVPESRTVVVLKGANQ